MILNKEIILFCLLGLAVISGCSKDSVPSDKLPPITETGANTLGCLINGSVWIPKGQDNKPNPRYVYGLDINGIPYLTVEGIQVDNTGYLADFIFVIDSLNGTGTHTIYRNKKDLVFLSQSLSASCKLEPDDTTSFKTGEIIVTKYDVPNQIISGTFDFTYKTETCDSVKITDGRFDLKL